MTEPKPLFEENLGHTLAAIISMHALTGDTDYMVWTARLICVFSQAMLDPDINAAMRDWAEGLCETDRALVELVLDRNQASADVVRHQKHHEISRGLEILLSDARGHVDVLLEKLYAMQEIYLQGNSSLYT
jgi:hypothetical protein